MKLSPLYVIIILLLMASCSRKTHRKEILAPKYLTSQDLNIETEDSIYISGRLEYASTNKLVIFIAGSGPTDKDCNNSMGLKTDAFKKLASHLVEHGISSFRFDKRSVGNSTYVEESNMVFDSFVNDVYEIIKYFEKDFREIIILGHSEGALIGSIVSGRKSVKAFISVSGTSISLDKIVLDQLAKYPKLVPLAQKHIDEINNDQPLSEVNPMLKSLFRPSVVPYLKSVFRIDPKVEISKLNKPILIINGTCDLQVPVEHAKALHQASSNSKLVLIEHMGHVLKELQPACSNAREAYSNPEMHLNSEFKTALLNFLKSV